MSKLKIEEKLGEVIEDLQGFLYKLNELGNTPIYDFEKELHRLRRDFNEFIIDELVLIKEEGIKDERKEKVES